MTRAAIFAFAALLVAGCAGTQHREERRPPPDAVGLNVGYEQAFDRFLDSLQKMGYELRISDRRVGMIQTFPKGVEADGKGAISYRGFFAIFLEGDDRASHAIVEFILIPGLSSERDRLLSMVGPVTGREKQ